MECERKCWRTCNHEKTNPEDEIVMDDSDEEIKRGVELVMEVLMREGASGGRMKQELLEVFGGGVDKSPQEDVSLYRAE